MEKINIQNKLLIIKKKDPINFEDKYSIFLRDCVKPEHILAIKQIDTQSYKKDAYWFNGVKRESVVDKIDKMDS